MPLPVPVLELTMEAEVMTSQFRALLEAAPVLEAAPDAMVIADREGKIVLANAQTEKLFGYTRSELLGKPVEMLIPDRYRSAHPSHRLAYFSSPRARPMGGGGLPLLGRRKDGTEFPAEISLSPLETDEGLLAITAIRDVTDRKRAEDERKKLDQAQEAIRMRDEFLSIASHELKTPLTALQVQAESVLRSTRRDPQAPVLTIVEKVDDIHSAVQRLTLLINQLLDLSRITAGRLSIQTEEMDLSLLARTVTGQFRDAFARAGCELRLEAASSVVGRWDPIRVEQILTNLLTNAIKYGEGKPIEVTVSQLDGKARLTVRDHGIGIAPEHQARIFERFERIVSLRNYGGFGLGLWIVRQIIEAHHGSIQVWSQPGMGSMFTVELPLGPDVRVGPGKASAQAEISIMFVEDDPMIRSSFCEVLQDEGFTVAAATNGLEAMQLLHSGLRPRIIFLDLMMPVMDAWAFRAEQQRHRELARIPVVVVSAAADVERRADALGAIAYLKKPVRLEALFELAQRYCN